MTSVFVVRHPQTVWNLEQRYQGRLEAPLTDEGRAQAEIVAGVFAGRELDAVYSSPLGRSLELANDIASKSSAPIYVDHRFTEMALGPWEGLYRAEIERDSPDLYQMWYARPDCVQFPGGEALVDVARRAQSGLRDVFDRHPSGQVVLVSHTSVIQSLAASALAIPPRELHRVRVSNCGITTLCGLQPPGSILSLNSTAHLYQGPLGAAAAENCVSWRERRVTL